MRTSWKIVFVAAATLAAAACVAPAPAPAAQPSPVVIVVTATPGAPTPTPQPPTPIVIVVTATPGPATSIAPAASLASAIPASASPAQGNVPAKATNQLPVAANRVGELAAVREAVRLRVRDLAKATQNARAEMADAHAPAGGFRQPPLGFMHLDGVVTNLLVTIASYGLGTDPYQDGVPTMMGGSLPARRPPSFGLPASTNYGIPRLLEAYLAAADVPERLRQAKVQELERLVEPYSNPGAQPAPFRILQTRGIYSGAEKSGPYFASRDYQADMTAVDRWLADLAGVLDQVPAFFPEPIGKDTLS